MVKKLNVAIFTCCRRKSKRFVSSLKVTTDSPQSNMVSTAMVTKCILMAYNSRQPTGLLFPSGRV